MGQPAERPRERRAAVFHRHRLDSPEVFVRTPSVLVRRRLVRLQRRPQRVRPRRGRRAEHGARVTRSLHHGRPSHRVGHDPVAPRDAPDGFRAPSRDAAFAQTGGVRAPRRGPALHHPHAHRVRHAVPLDVDPHRRLYRRRVLDEHLHGGVLSNLARVAKVHPDVVVEHGTVRDVRRVTSHGLAVQTTQHLVLNAQTPDVGGEGETQRFRRAVDVHRDQSLVPRARPQRRENKPHSLGPAGRNLILAPVHVEVHRVRALLALALGLGRPPEHRREHGHVLDHNLPLHRHIHVARPEVNLGGG